MKDELEKNIKADKKARAKRADIEAMRQRFDIFVRETQVQFNSIIRVVKSVKEEGYASEPLALIARLASGTTLYEIVNEAGIAALGLGNE